MAKRPDYQLEDQIGFVLRRVTQRHLALFSAAIPQVTTTQWAVIARLSEIGPMSQNHLGREAAMDAATVKGVVDRLVREGLVETAPDPDDKRRVTVALTAAGRDLFQAQLAAAAGVSEATLSPLTAQERAAFMALLARLT